MRAGTRLAGLCFEFQANGSREGNVIARLLQLSLIIFFFDPLSVGEFSCVLLGCASPWLLPCDLLWGGWSRAAPLRQCLHRLFKFFDVNEDGVIHPEARAGVLLPQLAGKFAFSGSFILPGYFSQHQVVFV